MAVWSVVKTSSMTHDIRWDAEHYRPEYLRQEREVRKLKTKPLIEVANVSDGNHLSIAEEFGDEGVRYLRGQDLGDFFISDSDPIYIPEKHYDALARSHMFPGDVLVGVVGTIGTVGLVTKRHGKLTGNCKLAIVRSKTLPGEYIAAYLASRLGQYEIKRRVRGAVQMGLILPDLKEIPIVEPTKAQLDRVVGAVQGAQEARHRAAETIAAAEARLMEALGLDRLDLNVRKYETSRLKKMVAADRYDAEHFCMAGLRKWKSPFETKPLGDPSITTWLSNGATPAADDYAETGYPIVKVGDVDKDARAIWGGERVLPGVPAARGLRGELLRGDVVVLCAAHHIRYIGKAGLFDGIQGYSGPVRSVGELITARAGVDVNPQSLCLYLNLPAVRNEAQRHVRGMSAHLYPSDFRHVPVPVLPKKLQNALADSFDAAGAARQEAERLLDGAKRIVEALIAEGGGGNKR